MPDRMGMFRALRHRDFRLYWLGFVSAVSGMQIFIVAQAWLIFDLTGSALDLGLLFGLPERFDEFATEARVEVADLHPLG